MKKTTIYRTISIPGYTPGDIVNPFITSDTLILFHPINWCSIDNVKINNYINLNLNIKISPEYKIDDGIPLSGGLITENLITKKQSWLYNNHSPVTTFYQEAIYELNSLFWCSLNSKRHL